MFRRVTEGGFEDMRHLISAVVVVLVLALAGCATRATKAFTVDVSPYSMQYTPGQIYDYLRVRGFQRVQFEDWDSGIMVYEKRNGDIDEQRFRLKTYPQILVIVRLEKKRNTFEKASPRVIVWLSEDNRKGLSEFAEEEYARLLDEVTNRVGSDRVREWPNQPAGSGQW